ncbi:MAG: amidohydrolase family protein [Clostridia bacterium]|nr:amidohydrolase family protein [Clostridia bacterium]
MCIRDRYGIDFALVSNVEGTEADHHQNLLPAQEQIDQIEVNRRVLDLVSKNPTKLGAQLWLKPHTEGFKPEVEELISKNRNLIYSLKFHPYHSKLSFASQEVARYLELARKYDLPVVTHTAGDEDSSPDAVYEVAKRNPDINFVMVHMGLGTDNERAIALISKLPNLYGDTTWVKPEKAMKAIKVCGIDKIVFGTDNPIDGLDTYNHEFYKVYLHELRDTLGQEDYDKLMYKNAVKLFKLKLA